MFLLAAGLLAVVFGVVKGESWGWASTGPLGSMGAGVLVLLVFGAYETRTVASKRRPCRSAADSAPRCWCR